MSDMAQLVDSTEAANRLADLVLDPQRADPIICVTIPAWASEPLLEVATLERALAGTVRVWIMPTGDVSWELSARLPTGLDVYGGAVRLWWPGVDEHSDRRDHPLFLLHDRADSPRVIERLLAALHQPPGRSRPDLGSEHGAVVTRVLPNGAELDLADGTPAFAHRFHLSSSNLAPERVVRVGQPVRVKVSQHDWGRRRRVPVSLLPFEPDPLERLLADYPTGTLIEGVVAELRNIGAFVTLLPGFNGLLHKTRISREYLVHPDYFFRVGQRVVVRILRLEPDERRVELSRLDIPEDAAPVVASVFPDGPPWLAPDTGRVSAAAELAAMAAASRTSVDVGGTPASGRDLALEESDTLDTTDVVDPTESDADELGEGLASRDGRALATTPTEPATTSQSTLTDAVELSELIEQAHAAQRETRALFDRGERRMARLRQEAAEIRRTLENDLADVRRRVLELAESETKQLIGSTQAELEAARAEAEQLREELAAVEADRLRLLDHVRDVESRTRQAERAARDNQEALRREREIVRQLQAELGRLAPDEQVRFRDEIYQAWQRLTTVDDRARYPWREPVIGPELLPSLNHVHGVSRERVVEVCAEVVCRRAPTRAGLEVHPLRTNEGGDSPQRIRSDGARAYRASLQVHTPAARRLHYWELPDGGVELAKIVYHDDYSIS